GSPGNGSGWGGRLPIEPAPVAAVKPPEQMANLKSAAPVCEICEQLAKGEQA
ncbi:type VI secretion system tip protein VgrG, partial [Aeromonas cavernicola]